MFWFASQYKVKLQRTEIETKLCYNIQNVLLVRYKNKILLFVEEKVAMGQVSAM
jgi:hypothetical protein